MKTLLALLESHPVAIGVLLGTLLGVLQCRRLVRRLERGELQVPDVQQPAWSLASLAWFFKAMFT